MSVVVPPKPQYSFLWLSPVCFRKLHGIFSENVWNLGKDDCEIFTKIWAKKNSSQLDLLSQSLTQNCLRSDHFTAITPSSQSHNSKQPRACKMVLISLWRIRHRVPDFAMVDLSIRTQTSTVHITCWPEEIGIEFGIFISHTILTTISHNVSFSISQNINTRKNNLTAPFFHRLTTCEHAASFRGPQLWNRLPLYLRYIEYLPLFKKNLKT